MTPDLEQALRECIELANGNAFDEAINCADKVRDIGPALLSAVRNAERVAVFMRERDAERARFQAVVAHLSHIHGLLHAPDVTSPDGRRFKFHPPDALVRDVWEGLSNAIREIPTAIDTATKERT